jgi:hypothetical protein
MRSNKPARIPIWLIIVYVFALLAWPFVAFMSVFAFDAPGSVQDPAIWATVIAVLSYPLLPLIGIPGSFFAFRRDHRRLAYALTAVGAIPFVMAVVALLAIFAMDLWFMLGAGGVR